MGLQNQIGFPGRDGDHSSRAIVNTVDEWLRTAGLPTYSELEKRLQEQGAGGQSSDPDDIVPEPPEFEPLAPARSPNSTLALAETIGQPVPYIRLTEVQKLILQRGLTGFRRSGAFRWVCERGEVRRDYLLLRKHGFIQSVRLCQSLAVAFATDEGRRALQADADRF